MSYLFAPEKKGDRCRLNLGQFFLDSTGGFVLKKRTRAISAKQTDPPCRSVYRLYRGSNRF